jgi:Tfp pilus assembly protein PilV
MKMKLSQIGDTIIDVLIAIGVISFVLGGAYVSARRSLIVSQRSNDRSEATNYVEQQLERLHAASRNRAPADPDNVFTHAPHFCLDDLLHISTVCSFGTNGRYVVDIDRTGNNFAITVTWPAAGGGSDDRISVNYRIYEQRVDTL